MEDKSPAASVGNGLPKETRVAVLFQRFGPYHHARLNAAGKLMRVFGVEACGMEDTYAWARVEGAAAFTRITLTDRYSRNRQWKREMDREMRRALNKIKPDAVVVPGWSSTAALSALSWCAEARTPAIMMSETTAWDEARSGWKERIKRRLAGICSAGLVGGRAHAEYLEQLGIERRKIFMGYDAVDNDYFAARAEEVRSQKSEVRSQHGLPENFFLASARFVEKKNLSRLIKAYVRYREMAQVEDGRWKMEDGGAKSEAGSQNASSGLQPPSPQGGEGITESGKQKTEIGSQNTSPRPSPQGGEGGVPWSLVLLGDGPLKSDLCHLISDLGLQHCALLPGFKQYDELPVYYGLARAFIHASTIEQWGLVVNEAMASGLPVLVSDRCGCAADLVQEGRNGFSFDPRNVEALAQLMLKISARNFPLSQFGLASREIISQWGTGRFADGLARAVKMSLVSPRPDAGPLDRLLLQILAFK